MTPAMGFTVTLVFGERMNQSIAAADATAGQSKDEAQSACDLCGSRQSRVVAEETADHCRIALCDRCGLMYASPLLSAAELDGFYDDAFTGDAGSPVFDAQQQHRAQKLRSEGKLAARWGIGVVEDVLNLRGKSVLDLRSRSGALAALLTERGAQVVSVDPFEANTAYAREVRGLADVRTMRFSVLHALDGIPDQSFDAVTALTQHLLAHVLSPHELLKRIFAVLRPGGYLILEEKDVLRPGKLRSASVFDTGKAHQFHFTRRTVELCARAAGFEVQSCALDPERVSVSQHILLIARRPEGDAPPVDAAGLTGDWQGPDSIVKRLESIGRTWRIHRIRADLNRTLRKLRRRLAGS